MGDHEAAAPTAALAPTPAPHKDLKFFGGISVEVTLEVASTQVTLQQLMELDEASVIALDKLAGEPLDVKVNGALFARAEVVVLNGNYGLRIVELCAEAQGDGQAASPLP
ncbi:flagellar motor switch protein FliN [Pseudomonas sp. HR96]|uniref:flagellar motor switch protein FliN n=1 Tax=Pseudomonas sp. HR96 TaxID=1027966 RepID=UPI002A759F55|nr:flagellar motor switch protein FliN [Pseudomonas sp. HR96]WPP02121.1 flagellar motor switch protein FliN [Pseudomonas sp. HR96]